MNVGMFGFPKKKFLYGTFFLNTAQSPYVAGDHIQFDIKLSGNLKLSTGTGQENGIISLPPGYVYLVQLQVITSDSGADNSLTNVGFYDNIKGDWILPNLHITRNYGVNTYFGASNPSQAPILIQLLPIKTLTHLTCRVYTTNNVLGTIDAGSSVSIFMAGEI